MKENQEKFKSNFVSNFINKKERLFNRMTDINADVSTNHTIVLERIDFKLSISYLKGYKSWLRIK